MNRINCCMKWFYLSSCFFVFPFLVTLSGPLNLSSVQKDSKFIFHMDMEAVRNSHFGSLLLKKFRNGEDGDKFKLFSKVIGFDFLKELNSITYFSNGAKDNGVVLFKHNANIERLVAIIKLDKNHRSTTYGQETIHGVGSGKDRTHICFPNQGLAILAPKRSLTHQALDVLGGKGSMKSLPICLQDAQNMDQPLLLIGYGDLTDLEDDFEGSDLQKHLSEVCATMREENREIRMNLQATALNNQSGEHIENAAKGIMSLIAMSKDSDENYIKFIDAIQIRRDSVNIEGNFRMGVDKLLEIMDPSIEAIDLELLD